LYQDTKQAANKSHSSSGLQNAALQQDIFAKYDMKQHNWQVYTAKAVNIKNKQFFKHH